MTSRLLVDLATKAAVSEGVIRKFWIDHNRVKAKSILAKNMPVERGATIYKVLSKPTRLKDKRYTGRDLYHHSLKAKYDNNSNINLQLIRFQSADDML